MMLKLLDQKEKRDMSASDFEMILENICEWDNQYPASPGTEKLKFPKSMRACMKLLEAEGYEEPIPYNFCMKLNHGVTMVFTGTEWICPTCSPLNREPNMVPFRYLSIASRLRQMARTPAYCRANLAHWRARADWLEAPKSSQSTDGVEMWHGQKNLFKKHSDFFDPGCTFEKPRYCATLECKHIFHVEVLREAKEKKLALSCPRCDLSQFYELNMGKGDPRNIAVMLHYDGWTAPRMGGTSKHKSG